MAHPYVRKSPREKEQNIFTLNKFGGGLDNVNGDTTIGDNKSTNCKNMMFVSDDIMETRYGTSQVDEITLTSPITYLDEYKPINQTPSMVRSSNTEIYIGANKISDVLGEVRGTTYIGKYYFIDGTNFKMYDGTNVYTVKEDPKTYSTVTIETSATLPINIGVEKLDERTVVGSLILHETVTGIKQYTVTAVDYIGKVITINEALTQKIEEGDMIRCYIPRSKALFFDGQIKYDETLKYVWYEPCEFELEDSYKGENYIPTNPNVLCMRSERLYISGDTENPHYIYMSDIANPIYFPSYISFQCPPNGDKIIDMLDFDDALVIGRHNDWFVIYGNSPDPSAGNLFRMKKIDAHIGLMARGSFAILNNMLFFLGYDGRFYKMNTPQTNIEYLMTRPLKHEVDIFKPPLNITTEDLNHVVTITYNNEFLMSVGNKVLVYSYNNQGFTFYEGWKNSSLYTDGKTVFIGDSDGKLSKWNSGVYSDLSRPIESIYETKRFDLGKSANYKFFNQCTLTTHAYNEMITDISLGFEIDFFSLTASRVVRSAQTLFGIAVWGDKFNDKNIMKSRWQLLNCKGRTIKFKFFNNAVSQPIRIYDMNVIWSNRDIR